MTEMARALSEEMEKNEQLEKQLTKAKGIIKKLMVFAEADLREYEEEYKEAEQFLIEVEKWTKNILNR